MEISDFLGDEVFEELKNDFLNDMRERLVTLNNHLLSIENKTFTKETLKECFRILHNMKGTSATLNFTEISTCAHKMEDWFSLLLDNKLEITLDFMTKLFTMSDLISKITNLSCQKNKQSEIHKLFQESLKLNTTPGKTVLLVESSKTIRNYIKKTLQKEGMQVLESSNSTDALIRCISEPVDFLVTSLEHQTIDGSNLIRMLKANQKTKAIKTVLLTSASLKLPESDFIINKDSQFLESIVQTILNN